MFLICILFHGHQMSHVPSFTMFHQTSQFPLPICFIMNHHIPILHLIPIQTMKHPLGPPPILTNHTPLINSPYQHLALCVNEGPQPYTFPNPANHAHVEPFPPSILLAPIVTQDQTPQPTPISSTHLQLPSKVFCPRCAHANLLVKVISSSTFLLGI